MKRENITEQKKTGEREQLQKFEIKVQNKFEKDRRNIHVWHKEKDKFDTDILYHKTCRPRPREKKYPLSPEGSLIIELGKENDFFEKDVHIELPYVADYKLFWEVEEGKEVDRPITSITRNTAPDSEIQSEGARTVIVIPRDQSVWKLEIKSPGNLKEHYHPKNLLTKYLEMDNGTPDNVTIGDNGDG